ncbi:unnamed protein product [Adineta steineri]|uniref:Derlin n=2 Tax=Adineta steineri TaxID=433720 RepID=A0A818XIZ7_9BILA|nr:unnamed protein product [Adineta steineri]CAF3739858.1 unnamed protein product [Adineta steineri]
MSTSNDLGQWYKSIPPITRTWFTACVVVPFATRFKIVNPINLTLHVRPIIRRFQIWRLLTCLLFYPLSFDYLINLYFLYQYSSRLETSTFDGKPADYVFCLFFLAICNIILGIILSISVLMEAMIFSVMYIWCQLNKETMMSFWFGMQFKAMYMPWVLLLFRWVISNTLQVPLCGIIVGHLYFFLVFKYPQDFGGAHLLQTPSFLYRYFPNDRASVSGFGTPPPPSTARRPDDPENNDRNPGRQIFGGRGHVLGGN